MPRSHVQVKQSFKWDKAQACVQAAVRRCDYILAEFAYCPLSRSNLREIADCALALLDGVNRPNASVS